MGKRGPASRLTATSAGYWVEPFPMTRERAGEILGQDVPPSAWQEIEKAFRDYQDLRTLSETPNDLAKKRDGAVKRLEVALQAVRAQLAESKANATFQSWARREVLSRKRELDLDDDEFKLDFGIADNLGSAATAISAALAIVRMAKPREFTLPGTAGIRRSLAQAIYNALNKAGLRVALSDGRCLPDDAAESELAPFERLCSEAGIHAAVTPAAQARWMRTAVKGQNSPKV